MNPYEIRAVFGDLSDPTAPVVSEIPGVPVLLPSGYAFESFGIYERDTDGTLHCVADGYPSVQEAAYQMEQWIAFLSSAAAIFIPLE